MRGHLRERGVNDLEVGCRMVMVAKVTGIYIYSNVRGDRRARRKNHADVFCYKCEKKCRDNEHFAICTAQRMAVFDAQKRT